MDVPPRHVLLSAGTVLALALSASVATTQAQAQEAATFPAFVWRLDHHIEDLPSRLVVSAFGGANVEGDDEASWVRAEGLDYYIGHAPGRDALHIDDHAAWYATLWDEYWSRRDATQLVRRPCLSEARTLEQLEARLRRSLAAREGATGLGVSLGDEVGLTRYGGPLDLCASSSCRAAFGRFLGASPRWDELARAEGGAPPYPDTDETRLAWTDGDPRHVGAWLARREFHHSLMIDTLAALSRRCRELAPEAPVGLLGLGGRTTFGGVGVEAILPHVDFLEAYAALDTRELLYTLRDDHQGSWLTVFREEGNPASAGWQVREHWLRGGDAVVLWSDRELSADPEYLAQTSAAVRDVRELRAALPRWRPRPQGLAIVHDPEAMALGWLRDALFDGPTWPKRFSSYHNQHGTREVALRGLLRLAEDAGLLPGALPFEAVDAETAQRFQVLVLCEQVVLEPAELARLEAYLDAGGHLLIQGRFDQWNLAGQPSELDAYEDLRGRHGERVRRLEFDPSHYLAMRCAAPRPHALGRIRELHETLDEAGVQRPSWRPRATTGACPWLRAEVPGEAPGERICAAIPNLQVSGERAGLRTLDVRIEGLEQAAIEWIAPRPPAEDGRVSLKAGEVLVFRISPR